MQKGLNYQNILVSHIEMELELLSKLLAKTPTSTSDTNDFEVPQFCAPNSHTQAQINVPIKITSISIEKVEFYSKFKIREESLCNITITDSLYIYISSCNPSREQSGYQYHCQAIFIAYPSISQEKIQEFINNHKTEKAS